MLGHRITANISLSPSAAGDADFCLPSGTPSVLVVFVSEAGQVQFGATIATQAREPLVPGGQYSGAILEFLADEAAIYASPATPFGLWYGRPIGSGTVLEVLDGFDDVGGESDG